MKFSVDLIRSKAVPVLKRYGIKEAAIFGSTVRGERRRGSDIDFVVEMPKNKSLLDLIGLQLDLKTEFKTNIDVVTYESLHPMIRKHVLMEQVRII